MLTFLIDSVYLCVCTQYIFKGFRGEQCQSFVHSVLISLCVLDSSIKSNTRITVLAKKPTTAFRTCEQNVCALRKRGDLSEGQKSVQAFLSCALLSSKRRTPYFKAMSRHIYL